MCPLNLINGCAYLGNKNCSQAFAISGNMSLHHCGGNWLILLCRIVEFWSINSLFKVMLKYVNLI